MLMMLAGAGKQEETLIVPIEIAESLIAMFLYFSYTTSGCFNKQEGGLSNSECRNFWLLSWLVEFARGKTNSESLLNQMF